MPHFPIKHRHGVGVDVGLMSHSVGFVDQNPRICRLPATNHTDQGDLNGG